MKDADLSNQQHQDAGNQSKFNADFADQVPLWKLWLNRGNSLIVNIYATDEEPNSGAQRKPRS